MSNEFVSRKRPLEDATTFTDIQPRHSKRSRVGMEPISSQSSSPPATAFTQQSCVAPSGGAATKRKYEGAEHPSSKRSRVSMEPISIRPFSLSAPAFMQHSSAAPPDGVQLRDNTAPLSAPAGMQRPSAALTDGTPLRDDILRDDIAQLSAPAVMQHPSAVPTDGTHLRDDIAPLSAPAVMQHLSAVPTDGTHLRDDIVPLSAPAVMQHPSAVLTNGTHLRDDIVPLSAPAVMKYISAAPAPTQQCGIFPPGKEQWNPLLHRTLSASEKLCNEYDFISYLGSGCSGFVLGAKRLSDKRDVAVKFIFRQRGIPASEVAREINVMTRLQPHSNVLQLLDSFDVELENASLEYDAIVSVTCVVVERAASSLFDILHDYYELHEKVKLSTVKEIFRQVAEGLKSLHDQCIVHGDLKDANVLTFDGDADDGRIKLCDFGHSHIVLPESHPSMTSYGTPAFDPPEMDDNVQTSDSSESPIQEFSGYEADIWALGLILYKLVEGDMPSEVKLTDPAAKAEYMARRKTMKFPFKMPTRADESLQNLLRSLLCRDMDERLTIDQVLNHPWLNRQSSLGSTNDANDDSTEQHATHAQVSSHP
ncbi:Serine/threonine-protein kinase stk11 [Actinomortierella wolfii]|nr:Serine/threonine-protein kinase stk11 [Actinomortierella wolfii]